MRARVRQGLWSICLVVGSCATGRRGKNKRERSATALPDAGYGFKTSARLCLGRPGDDPPDPWALDVSPFPMIFSTDGSVKHQLEVRGSAPPLTPAMPASRARGGMLRRGEPSQPESRW